MSECNVNSQHGLDMGVQVVKSSTGRTEGHVSEYDLERFGFGRDPRVAVELYKSHMEDMRLESVRNGAEQPTDNPSWLTTDITVHSDEDYGYSTGPYHLKLDGVINTTRKQKALRLAAQYLLDLANDCEPDPVFVSGKGIELTGER